VKRCLNEERIILAQQASNGNTIRPTQTGLNRLVTNLGDTVGTWIFNWMFPLFPVYNFGQLTRSLVRWTAGESVPETVEDFIALFHLLEIHANNSGQKPLIIIWREIQNLAELRNAPTTDWPRDLLYLKALICSGQVHKFLFQKSHSDLTS